MDLLDTEYEEKKDTKTKGQKIILTCLILAIILAIILIIAIYYLSANRKEITPYSLEINGNIIDLTTETMILKEVKDETGENVIDRYVSLKQLCDKLCFIYNKGEYLINDNDDSCYIDNNMDIVCFNANSKDIYKATKENDIDYQKYKLESEIIYEDNLLYINIKDLKLALNIIIANIEKSNKTIILSPEYYLSTITEQLTTKSYEVDNTHPENLKTICEGMLVVKRNNILGVIDINFEEVIGIKYSDIIFNEYNQEFIVANEDKKYGIITKEGDTKVTLFYESIEQLNYSPVLYKVKKQESFGILDSEYNILLKPEYKEIGYPRNIEKDIKYTLIIPEIEGIIKESIVVKKDNKYGLVSLENGKVLLNFELDAIFSKTDENNNIYYIVQKDKEANFLDKYIEKQGQVTVNISD